MKIISNNKKAYHDYFILETFEAGIELKGTEIKSIRKGSANLKDCFVRIKDHEAFIENMYIAPYENGNIFNHEPRRIRKLLLHKKEISKLEKKVREDGLTIVPTKLYFNTSKAKLEIALAKGKKLYDKRNDLKEKDAKRDIEKALKRAYSWGRLGFDRGQFESGSSRWQTLHAQTNIWKQNKLRFRLIVDIDLRMQTYLRLHL